MKLHSFRIIIGEENKILDTLSTDENLLESDAAVQLISSSRMQINELLEKLNVSKVTEKQIDVTRMAYKAFSIHASIVYFTIGNVVLLNNKFTYELLCIGLKFCHCDSFFKIFSTIFSNPTTDDNL